MSLGKAWSCCCGCGCGGSGGDDQTWLTLHVCGDGGDRSASGAFVRSLFHACFTTCWSTCLASTSETFVRCIIFSTQRCIIWLEPRPHVPGWRGQRGALMRSRMEISFCGKVPFGGSEIHLLRTLLLFERIHKRHTNRLRCPLAPGRRARGSACSGETASNGESESRINTLRQKESSSLSALCGFCLS